MKIVFSKVDILYYLGLDCPLSSEGINIITMHSEIGGRKASFLESAIRTSCYLLSHITKQHKLEIENIKIVVNNSYKKHFKFGIPKIEKDDIEKIFFSPIELYSRTVIDRNLVQMFRRLKRESDNLYDRTRRENDNLYDRIINSIKNLSDNQKKK